MKSPTLALVAAAAAVLLSGAANAAVVSLSGMTAKWYAGTPAGNVSYNNNGTVSPEARWGTGGNKSGYDFDIANQPINFVVPPSPSPNAVLGTFTHLNQPIGAGSSITGIKLKINATVSVDGNPQGALAFNYAFAHNETDNGANPCANGGANGTPPNQNGCADEVTATWLASSDDFVVGLDTYTLNVIGFSLTPDGLNPFNSFWTAEQKDNVAYLVGNVALKSDVLPPDEIPEPATLPLLALALAGLYATRRAKAKKN